MQRGILIVLLLEKKLKDLEIVRLLSYLAGSLLPPTLLFTLLNGFQLMTSMLAEVKQASSEPSGRESGTWLNLLCLEGQFKGGVCFYVLWELCGVVESLLLLP